MANESPKKKNWWQKFLEYLFNFGKKKSKSQTPVHNAEVSPAPKPAHLPNTVRYVGPPTPKPVQTPERIITKNMGPLTPEQAKEFAKTIQESQFAGQVQIIQQEGGNTQTPPSANNVQAPRTERIITKNMGPLTPEQAKEFAKTIQESQFAGQVQIIQQEGGNTQTPPSANNVQAPRIIITPPPPEKKKSNRRIFGDTNTSQNNALNDSFSSSSSRSSNGSKVNRPQASVGALNEIAPESKNSELEQSFSSGDTKTQPPQPEKSFWDTAFGGKPSDRDSDVPDFNDIPNEREGKSSLSVNNLNTTSIEQVNQLLTSTSKTPVQPGNPFITNQSSEAMRR